MQDQTKTLTGCVKRITFHNPENGYTVARLDTAKGLFTVVGIMPGLDQGQEITVRGKYILHPKFGPQVEVESVSVSLPTDEEGVKNYLASGLVKGVGPKLAERIVDHLGSKACEVILEDPEKLAQVPGIGDKKAESITRAVKDHRVLRDAMVFLQGHGIGASTALRIYKHYKGDTLAIMKTQPHRLAADIRGIGFATADQIASRLGIAQDDPSRLEAGILHTLSQALEKGHLFLPYDELMQNAANILKVERGLLGQSFVKLHAGLKLTIDEDDQDKRVYLSSIYSLEQRAAQTLARLAKKSGLLPGHRAVRAVEWVSGQLKVQPSLAQKKALEKLLTAGLAVLTGGPGTGKTTLLKALITIAKRMELSVALAAPTGRAAKRLGESTGETALTLHRLLEFSPKENRFAKNANRPIDANLLVVDESSMIDIWLMANLAEAVGPDCRLILVGDADQLPSVGPGLVLRQIIDSKVIETARINEIFRQDQAGLLVKNAHRILHGQMPELPPQGAESDFYFIDQKNPEKNSRLLKELVCQRLPAHYGFDPARDIQVLAPMHKGILGCRNLNQMLREELNPASRESLDFQAGDKVMQVRNNYDLEVFNGDMGFIVKSEDAGCLVAMGDRQVEYSQAELEDLTLAYCVTIHKSQGSEYPAVVVVLGMEHYIMLNRPLLYTAVTRGKKLVLVIGDTKALKRAVKENQPINRNARLDVSLKKLFHG
jgi:exodeoxyribonuclease V alpha subunit